MARSSEWGTRVELDEIRLFPERSVMRHFLSFMVLLLVMTSNTPVSKAEDWRQDGQYVTASLYCEETYPSKTKGIHDEYFGRNSVFVLELTTLGGRETSSTGQKVYIAYQYWVEQHARNPGMFWVMNSYMQFYRTLEYAHLFGGLGLHSVNENKGEGFLIDRKTLEAELRLKDLGTIYFNSMKYQCELYNVEQREEALDRLEAYKDAWVKKIEDKKKRNKI